MKRTQTIGRWLWWFSLIAAAILFYKTSYNFSAFLGGLGGFISIFTPFIIAFFLTFVLYAPESRLERLLKKARPRWVTRGARALSIVICYLLFFAVVVGLLVLLLPSVYNAAGQLVKVLSTYYVELSGRLETLTAAGGWLDKLNLTESFQTLYNSAIHMLLSLANTENILTVVKSALSVTSTLVNLLMAVIISIYMLSDREMLLSAVKSLLGAFLDRRRLSFLSHYVHKTADIFYKYLYGALMDAAVVSVLMTVGLLIFGVPQAPLLGCMIGLLNFIPYFGAIIGGCVVAIITLLTKNIYTAIGVAVYILVMQQIDGNIIQPRIVGQTVGLRPIYVLFAITVGGGLFGMWGILLGVPVMAVLLMLLQDFIAYRKQKQAQKAEETAE